ncbi:MAG: ribonuclease [Betaproteobacteria bacterium]|nr:ribonuclease [Betaproteobacteria bacterium]MBK9606043.1 ribonuclease [Betaproteobacteria bacterium]
MKSTLLRAGMLVLACLLLATAGVHARDRKQGDVAVDNLPQQALRTLQLIRSNGPFPYDRDGVVFGNRERALPDKPRGYYREYTVKTPGVRGRGAKRIVCGGEQRPARECYYTDDHYRTFRHIR